MSNPIKNLPTHIAIIPDGNRRWAKKRKLQPWLGHRAGAKAFEKVLEKALELKIPYLTFWSGSWDNLTKRPKIEVNFLFKVYADWFQRIAKDKRIHQNKVRVNFLGRWKEILPQTTQRVIEKALTATKDYHQHSLTFLLAYNGMDEMRDCLQKITELARNKPIKITEKLIKENLWTKDLPPVDLVIRTGCQDDPHLSAGFMMWDTAYSQLHFTQTLLPSFTSKEFAKIIQDYAQRERRMGA